MESLCTSMNSEYVKGWKPDGVFGKDKMTFVQVP